MMELDRHKQYLILDGREYSSADIRRLLNESSLDISRPLLDLFRFLDRWFDDSPFMTVHTSGSTGIPKEMLVEKKRMMQSARLTCEFLGLQCGDAVLLCMDLRYIGAMMVVVRSLVFRLNLIVRVSSGHPLFDVKTPLRFAAMVPLQVYNTLQVPEERKRLSQTDILIIGGGAVDAALEKEIQTLPNAVYSTYGMTETLSHIALRRLNGSAASLCYKPFPSVYLSLSADGTLVIDAPLVCEQVLVTNDVAQIYPDGTFIILGRKDNIINSGGVKVQAERVEEQLSSLISVPFVITSVPDIKFGEAIVLLLEYTPALDEIQSGISSLLSSYHCPKYVRTVEKIPLTENGKINRSACRALALDVL